MTLPGNAAGFTLTGGPYDDPAFQGMAGKLTLSAPVTHVATGERVRKTWAFSIDYNGQFSVGPLPWTDDPAFTPTGFTYTVEWQALAWKDVPGNLTFSVPRAAGSTVDFDTLIPATSGGVAIPFVHGIPAGGASGQVLAKASGTDYDVTWTAQTGGTGGGAVASVNAKTGTVVLSASDVGADAAGAATAAQAAAVAAAATDATTKANAAQAAAVQRANHTGTQAASTITGLSTVATSGAYTDLSGKPTIPPLLTPTATKTAAYTAVVGDLAMMNVAGGATALTLPTAPADKAQVGYRAIGATTAVPLVVTAGGTDTIGTTGATSATLPMADEVVVLQYDAANTRWLAVSAVKTQASLDLRYTHADPVLSNFSYDATTGNLLSYQEDGVTITLTYNADGTVATSQRGTAPAKTYSYSGGNLVGVA